MDAPGYRKPTHGYGQPFGTVPETADDEARWAGRGFDEVPAPEVLEPVDRAA